MNVPFIALLVRTSIIAGALTLLLGRGEGIARVRGGKDRGGDGLEVGRAGLVVDLGEDRVGEVRVVLRRLLLRFTLLLLGALLLIRSLHLVLLVGTTSFALATLLVATLGLLLGWLVIVVAGISPSWRG